MNLIQKRVSYHSWTASKRLLKSLPALPELSPRAAELQPAVHPCSVDHCAAAEQVLLVQHFLGEVHPAALHLALLHGRKLALVPLRLAAARARLRCAGSRGAAAYVAAQRVVERYLLRNSHGLHHCRRASRRSISHGTITLLSTFTTLTSRHRHLYFTLGLVPTTGYF